MQNNNLSLDMLPNLNFNERLAVLESYLYSIDEDSKEGSISYQIDDKIGEKSNTQI